MKLSYDVRVVGVSTKHVAKIALFVKISLFRLKNLIILFCTDRNNIMYTYLIYLCKNKYCRNNTFKKKNHFESVHLSTYLPTISEGKNNSFCRIYKLLYE